MTVCTTTRTINCGTRTSCNFVIDRRVPLHIRGVVTPSLGHHTETRRITSPEIFPRMATLPQAMQPSGEDSTKSCPTTRDDILALMRKKDEIEATVKDLEELLVSQGNVGMDGPLLDSEGYPRNDIDVYSVRHARHSLICLNNDHAALMAQIEDGLFKLHAETRQDFMDFESVPSSEDSETLHAFAKIQIVTPDSPAAQAGLSNGDLVVVFGSATAKNFRSLQDIAVIVSNSENRSIPLKVIRDGSVRHITLTPRKWSGKGLLGCSFLEERRVFT